MEAHFARGVRRVTDAFAGLEVEPLVVAEVLYFQNVNTPEDWARYVAK
jgi:molybdopterin-guanine dinucleotide biosynthesis protein A